MRMIYRGVALAIASLFLAGGALAGETVLYRFKGAPDGFQPQARLIFGKDGALYSTTQFGGIAGPCPARDQQPGCGTVFKLAPPLPGQTVWTESVLYRLQGGSDGAYPNPSLITDAEGSLYAVAAQGARASSSN
jgi:hypothetical protein